MYTKKNTMRAHANQAKLSELRRILHAKSLQARFLALAIRALLWGGGVQVGDAVKFF